MIEYYHLEGGFITYVKDHYFPNKSIVEIIEETMMCVERPDFYFLVLPKNWKETNFIEKIWENIS